MPTAEAAPSPNIVISQIYGGGGNSGATYRNDFIELFNKSSASVSVNGWSVQYASATRRQLWLSNQLDHSTAKCIDTGGQLPLDSGSYRRPANGVLLPTVDVTDTTPIDMSATAGKVALVNSTTSLGCNGGSTPCSAEQLAQVVDLIGYGNANFFEGAASANDQCYSS